MHRNLVAVCAALLLAGTASAQDFTPAIIFDIEGQFDKSFNEAAYTGAEAFKDQTASSTWRSRSPTIAA